MNIIQIYKQFPKSEDCLRHLEKVKWGDKPQCPYCKSLRSSKTKEDFRHHCNNCNTTYNVTVGTVFHNTKLDLQKWFLAISLMLNAKKGISARQLSRDIEVNKNTAWYMLMRLRRAFLEQPELLNGIFEADETYVGGKDKNKHNSNKPGGTQGRNTKTKTAVFGILQRDGKVKAQKVKDVGGKTLLSIISRHVEKGSAIMTDQWTAYMRLSEKFKHLKIDHSRGEYVNGECHTNTIEGFWSLFKRGIVGQYHQISDKYIDKYLDEFAFRYSNRKNDLIFDLTLEKALGI